MPWVNKQLARNNLMDTIQEPFYRRIWKQLPILFPLIALFHLAILAFSIYTFSSQGVLDTLSCGGACLDIALYTIFWIFVCDTRRWASLAYIVLTAINLLIFFFLKGAPSWHTISGILQPFDVLMCFFLLYYYKRFR